MAAFLPRLKSWASCLSDRDGYPEITDERVHVVSPAHIRIEWIYNSIPITMLTEMAIHTTSGGPPIAVDGSKMPASTAASHWFIFYRLCLDAGRMKRRRRGVWLLR